MPETTPEMLAMARRAAASVHPYSHNSALILDGERDGTDIVQSALAAIKEAVPTEAVQVERVIDLIEEKLCIIWNEAGREEFKTLLHAALRNGEHYHD